MKLKTSPMIQIGQEHLGQGKAGSYRPQEGAEKVALGIPQKLTTIEMAACLRISPKTPIAALSRAGNYLGLIPTKLGNGRLLWDADKVSRLLNGVDL
jgi:hypothetical protein